MSGRRAFLDRVAVSSSAFVGLGLEDPGTYRKLLGPLRPAARIGRSILVFRIPGGAAGD